MLAQALVSLRESVEAAIIIAIVSAVFDRAGERDFERYFLAGCLAGVLASLAAGWLAYAVFSFWGFNELFEAISAFFAVLVLTGVIYWMSVRGAEVRRDVERKAAKVAVEGRFLPVAGLGFLLVFREGFETVLFVMPLLFTDPLGTVLGVLLGVAGGVLLAFFIFFAGLKLSLASFFRATSVLLVFVAGGVLGYGVHEVLEFGERVGWYFGVWSKPVYRLPFDDGHFLHDKGVIGALLSALFGYAVEMELLRFVVQVLYVVVSLSLLARVFRRS